MRHLRRILFVGGGNKLLDFAGETKVAMPLLTVGLTTPWGLALTLRRHNPIHITRATLNAMMREDERRFKLGELPVDKDEVTALAQAKEGFLLESEAEMHAPSQTHDP